MRRFLALLFVLFASVSSAFGKNAEVFEAVTLTATAPSLYAHWAKRGSTYSERHAWKDVWQANCDRLKIACTDAAWRKVPVGTVVYLPGPDLIVVSSDARDALALVPRSAENEYVIDATRIPSLEREVDALRGQNSGLASVNADHLKKIAALEEAYEKHMTYLYFAIFAVFICIVLLVVTIVKKRGGDADSPVDRGPPPDPSWYNVPIH